MVARRDSPLGMCRHLNALDEGRWKVQQASKMTMSIKAQRCEPENSDPNPGEDACSC